MESWKTKNNSSITSSHQHIWMFQKNNDPKHTSKLVVKWIEQTNIRFEKKSWPQPYQTWRLLRSQAHARKHTNSTNGAEKNDQIFVDGYKEQSLLPCIFFRKPQINYNLGNQIIVSFWCCTSFFPSKKNEVQHWNPILLWHSDPWWLCKLLTATVQISNS